MRSSLLLILLVLFVGSASADPIDALVTRLTEDHLWLNGASPILGLPETTSPEQVVGKVFEKLSFGSARVKQFTVTKQREVHIPGPLPDVYIAVLVQTDLGAKIVLLQYHAPPSGWWSRVYDADPA